MFYAEALHVAERTLLDGATLTELKQASMDLRALNAHSALADLVDAKIESIESQNGYSDTGDTGAG
jgi:hypothetical protein